MGQLHGVTPERRCKPGQMGAGPTGLGSTFFIEEREKKLEEAWSPEHAGCELPRAGPMKHGLSQLLPWLLPSPGWYHAETTWPRRMTFLDF